MAPDQGPRRAVDTPETRVDRGDALPGTSDRRGDANEVAVVRGRVAKPNGLAGAPEAGQRGHLRRGRVGVRAGNQLGAPVRGESADLDVDALELPGGGILDDRDVEAAGRELPATAVVAAVQPPAVGADRTGDQLPTPAVAPEEEAGLARVRAGCERSPAPRLVEEAAGPGLADGNPGDRSELLVARHKLRGPAAGEEIGNAGLSGSRGEEAEGNHEQDDQLSHRVARVPQGRRGDRRALAARRVRLFRFLFQDLRRRKGRPG